MSIQRFFTIVMIMVLASLALVQASSDHPWVDKSHRIKIDSAGRKFQAILLLVTAALAIAQPLEHHDIDNLKQHGHHDA
ncbi:hypothetical protein BDR26DRAFT_1007149 [Obelidium mucronatum]|nr:hypothetical protein BDR26DRAFT_1007149 [Obelidium mucronatum]